VGSNLKVLKLSCYFSRWARQTVIGLFIFIKGDAKEKELNSAPVMNWSSYARKFHSLAIEIAVLVSLLFKLYFLQCGIHD
jgi:membrane-anchored glycerophosphoryl diester phosphodiesterase (GDPDase)